MRNNEESPARAPATRTKRPARRAEAGSKSWFQRWKENCVKDFKQWKVLMWKHLLVRKRKCIMTFFEILFPCLMIIFALLLKMFILWMLQNHPEQLTKAFQGKKASLRSHDRPEQGPLLVMYTPKNAFTNELMDHVGKNMNLRRIQSFPGATWSGYYGFSEQELPLIDYLARNSDKSVIVTFQSLYEDQKNVSRKLSPTNLRYTIKIDENYMTDSRNEFGLNERLPGTVYKNILRLQWAIDSNYVQMISKNKTKLRADSSQVVAFKEKDDLGKTLIKTGVFFRLFEVMLIMAIMVPFIMFNSMLMEDRSSGMQEMVKQVGMSYDVISYAHGCNMILTGLVLSICGTVICKITTTPILPKTNGFFIFLALELYFHSIISLAFICSHANKSGAYASTIGMVFYCIAYVPKAVIDITAKRSSFLNFLLGLLPHVPFGFISAEFKELEAKNVGFGFRNFAKSNQDGRPSVLMLFMMMLLQILLILKLNLYLNTVTPGKYGVGKPWDYCLSKKKDHIAAAAIEEVEAEKLKERDPRYFEGTRLTDVGINVENVSKIFNKTIVLSSVTFEVYKGEITVLLGHNGAGKTTLMSIITGTLSLTQGRVLVNNYDIKKDTAKAQAQIGMCPQHNVFFRNFTVIEHVRFFAMAKGSSWKQAKESSVILLRRLGLDDKRDSQANELSGGMQRRLQLAMALSGNSEVLILDEPTSGLDVETRRNLWNLLLSFRGTHTMLLTTHFMEEADALGDRVVALHQGTLRCWATPMYLKKNIGTGYRLTLITFGFPKQVEIHSAVTSVIPNATIKEATLNTMTFNLPSQDTSKFPEMFSVLENRRDELEIESIGVGVSSLEEVFLRLCSNTETEFTEETVDTDIRETQYSKLKGFSLYVQQMKVLATRHMRYILWKKYGFLNIQVLMPIVIFVALTLMAKPEEAPPSPSLKKLSSMDEDSHENMNDYTLLLRADSPDSLKTVKSFRNYYNNVDLQYTNSVVDMFRASQDGQSNIQPSKNKEYILGLDFNNTNAKVVYSAGVRRAAPMAVNLLSNVYATRHMPELHDRAIRTKYETFRHDPEPFALPIIKNPRSYIGVAMYAVFLWMIIIITMANGVELSTKERLDGTRHIHLMSGVPPALHWLTTWLWHIALYGLCLLLPSSLICLLDLKSSTLNQISVVGALFVILLVSSMTCLPFIYFLSFSLSFRSLNVVIYILYIAAGVFPAVLILIVQVLGLKNMMFKPLQLFFNLCYYVCPLCPAVLAVLKAFYVARLNALCNLNLAHCQSGLLIVVTRLPKPENKGFDPIQCCKNKKGSMCILCGGEFGVVKELITVLVQMIFYAIMVVMAQHGIWNGICDRLWNCRYKPPQKVYNDINVQNEQAYVDSQVAIHPSQRQGWDSMLVHDVHKNYHRFCNKDVNAVRGINFSVRIGECFGLLGVNGAGKSTTFQMITADEVTTRGTIYSSNIRLKWPRSNQYLRSLSYCPQHFGTDEFQTGHDNLTTLLALRGLNTSDRETETNIWLKIVGLEKYRDQRVEGYSGGCMRRLATAAALSSGAPVTLLDEPTSGVDVSARRRVWVALRKGLRENRAVIITSHSMDEMEALCDRIAIMSDGEIAALGSAPALRSAYAKGHSLIIKLLHDATDPESIQRFKETVMSMFNCSLVDEHATMLQFHINETIPYSKLFAMLEDLNRTFEPAIVEDYSVTETTLEEVFLSFAKDSEERKEAAKRKKEKNKKAETKKKKTTK